MEFWHLIISELCCLTCFSDVIELVEHFLVLKNLQVVMLKSLKLSFFKKITFCLAVK